MPPAAANHRRVPPQSSALSQKKLLLFFLKCVIMVVVISIFLFFLGFAAVLLLHFLLISTTFHRRFSGAAACAGDASGEAWPALLPGVSYSVELFPMVSDCAICLDGFREGDGCRSIPGCNHLFHSRCVDRWIRKKPTCPVCRNRVDLDRSGLSGSRVGVDDDQWKRLWVVNFEEGTSY